MEANQEVYRGFPAYHIKALNNLAVSLQLVCVWWGEAGGGGEVGQGKSTHLFDGSVLLAPTRQLTRRLLQHGHVLTQARTQHVDLRVTARHRLQRGHTVYCHIA